MDTVDKPTRSKIMSRVRGKDTSPELIIRKALHKRGFRYRLQVKDLPGRPDLVLPKYRAVLFVNGCFWHRHGCHMSTIPRTKQDYWDKKFMENIKRDQRVLQELRSAGWRVLLIWECSLKGKTKLGVESVIARTIEWLVSDGVFEEIPPKVVR